MNILYNFGIAILLMGRTDSFIEDAKTDKNIQQRILLRKLQIVQPKLEVKPSTWNEILADVLVNKIRIFSFKNQDKEDVIKEGTVLKDRTILANFFSNVFIVYKKFIYDAFVGKHDTEHTVTVTPHSPESTESDKRAESEDIVPLAETIYKRGPKSEVEFVEPKYHGKITFEEVTTTEDPAAFTNQDNLKRQSDHNSVNSIDISKQIENTDLEIIKTPSDTKGNVDAKEENVECTSGLVKSDNGDCVKSRLILAIPNQCPMGYRRDFLGNCRRIIFNF